VNPFKSSIYWRLLIWFCAANLLVLFLGSYLTQRFVEYTTAVEINWTALAHDANQHYESGGAPALAMKAFSAPRFTKTDGRCRRSGCRLRSRNPCRPGSMPGRTS
jgi:hypothetical protein